MTANALKEDHEKCLAAGMNDYLSKPIRTDELKEAIEKLGALLNKITP
jgi:CheY-like chemotaxis protein